MRDPTSLPLPKTLGAGADELLKTQKARLALQAQADVLGKREDQLEQHLLKLLQDAGLTAAKGNYATIGRTEKTLPHVEPQHWPKVFGWIAKSKAFELLTRKLNSKALQERLKARAKLPKEITTFTKVGLSVRKLGGRKQ